MKNRRQPGERENKKNKKGLDARVRIHHGLEHRQTQMKQGEQIGRAPHATGMERRFTRSQPSDIQQYHSARHPKTL